MRRCFITIWLCFVIFPIGLKADIQIVSSDNQGVKFIYLPGQPVRRVNGLNDRIEFPDAEPIAALGEYDLPAKVVRIGVPQREGVRVKFRTKQGGEWNNFNLERVPYVLFSVDSVWRGEVRDREEVYPVSVVETEPIEVLRSVRFVTLKIYPAQYRPIEQRLVWFEEVEVVVQFQATPELNLLPEPIDCLIAGMLLNGEQAQNWKLSAKNFSSNPYSFSPNWVKIKVNTTGMYRITGMELARLGVPINNLDPYSLSLWSVGDHEPNRFESDSLRPVAIYVTGEEDGRFDLHDTIIFYGLAPDHWVNRCSLWVKNLYTRENVYWLTWTGGAGVRMRVGLGPEFTPVPICRTGRVLTHQESDRECPARAGLMWVWATISKPTDAEVARFCCPLELQYPIQIHRISGRFYNASSNNQVTIRLNGRVVSNFQFGVSSYPAPYDFAIESVGPVGFGDNYLTIELRGNGEKKIFLDYLEIEYTRRLSLFGGQCHFFVETTGVRRFLVQDASELPLVLDITDPYAPAVCAGLERRGDSIVFTRSFSGWTEFVVATPKQMLKPSNLELKSPGFLWSANFSADYWIVTPEEFIRPAQDLARFRSNRVPGLTNARVRAVSLQKIYDDFGFGLAEPGAIKKFFQVKRPLYVLLVGDGTFDYRNNFNQVLQPGVPPFEFGFGLIPDAGDRSALAQDVWYADLDGEGGSPDLILGRINVRSEMEFRQFIDKLISYETASVGYWTRRFLLMADDEYQRYPDRPDELRFRHIEQCEGLGMLAGNRLDLEKFYLTEFPFLGSKSKPGANSELLRQLNKGALIWAFFGHGSAHSLTHEEVLNVAQVHEITNQHRIPFCFFGSCSVGRFDDIRSECIAEELVRMSDGAVATVAASTATPSGNNFVFARNLFAELFSHPESVRTIGYCFFKTWITDRSYHLFGDPSTILQLPTMSIQNPYLSPETLQPGRLFRSRTIVELAGGIAEWRLFGPMRNRYYSSSVGSTSYLLPGLELTRGSFRVKDGRFYCEGVFPTGVPMDTVHTGNGYYAPLINSCRFSAQVKGAGTNLGVVNSTIPYNSTSFVSQDVSGPEIKLSYAGQLLQDSAVLPANLQLDIVVRDSSGIFISPVSGKAPYFYLNKPLAPVDISDRFVFEDSSYTTARASIGLNLSGPVDTFFVVVMDNFLNRTTTKLLLKPLQSNRLRIDSVTVYPNPVRQGAVFGFVLNRAAMVEMRIYTLNGRLVRNLGEVPAGSGYNQIVWDGRDENGVFFPNGVYLFTLRVKSFSLDGKDERVTVRDRFLVVR
ncbi:MAG: type IX secretion system sortase PorU [bacterium]